MVVIGSVWDRTVEFISDNLSAVVPLALMGIFVPLSLSTSLRPLAGGVGTTEKSIIYAAIILLELWGLWGQVAITALAFDPHGGRSAAVKIAGRRFPAVAGISLAMFGVALIAASPIVITLAATGYDFLSLLSGHPGPTTDGAQKFIVLYAMVLILVGLWAIARLIVLLPTLVMERRGLGVFARCFRLTRGNTLKIIGIVVLYCVVSIVAQLATQFVFGTVFELLFSAQNGVSLATILTSIMVGVVGTGFTVLATAFVAKLYLALRDARESIVNAR
jgi:hypothetical protein